MPLIHLDGLSKYYEHLEQLKELLRIKTTLIKNQSDDKESDFYYETLNTVLEVETTPNGQNPLSLLAKWSVGLVAFPFLNRSLDSKSVNLHRVSLSSDGPLCSPIRSAICFTSNRNK